MLHLDYADCVPDTISGNSFVDIACPEFEQNPESAMQNDPVDAQMLLKLGILYWRRNQFDRAEQLLTKALEISKESQEAGLLAQCFIGLALVKTSLGNNEEAMVAYEQALRLTPENLHIWNNLGSLYLKLGEHENAIYSFKKAIHNNPNDAMAWNRLATIYTQEGKIDEAMEAYQSQKDFDTLERRKEIVMNNTQCENPYAWNEKGNFHFTNKSFEEAIDSYEKAIEIDPMFGQAYNNLALIQFAQGNYNEAILLYKKSIKLLKSNQERAVAWNGLGNSYRRIKDYQNARIAYQNASNLDQEKGGAYEGLTAFETDEDHKTPEFWNDLGKLFFKIGVYDKAANAFKQAIRSDPKSGIAYSYLARTLTARGQYKEAIVLYQKSVSLLKNSKERATVLYWLGDTYRKLNEYDNALQAYQNAAIINEEKSNLMNRARFILLSNCTTS